ncbi:ANTAR domain-containing protein [Streptomyces sp. DSM 42041]|uniref:ANTAR domain-containing protein n=1 Tax=Streptomyces hazeniae TaxID=3075538 RepID=A0ABU2NLG7_9ACTN|nr:ANTAR domain-containing protein [Streptomyces sp. DSM 42041]MDT0377810.1 ANTAR domain-containing protein [Streptomyces sp. DSM 42041]
MSTFDDTERDAEGGRDTVVPDGAGPAGGPASVDGDGHTGGHADGHTDGEGRNALRSAARRVALEAEVERLRDEVGQLQQAIESRAVIDQARGMVMVMCRCTPHSAWDVLVEVSQHTNTKLRTVAGSLVATTDGSTRMPRELSAALAEALRRRRGHRTHRQR